MKNIEWWRGTATHMWRTFFAIKAKDADKVWNTLELPDQKFYAICNHIYTNYFVSSDQAILQMYFTSRWGDDQYAVEDYSLKNNIPTKVIWMVVRRANKLAMIETGFIPKKEEKQDE